MQEKYYTLYQLTGSSAKQGLQMPTCNNLDQSRTHHLGKKNISSASLHSLAFPPPQKKKQNKTKQTNKQITHDQEFTM